MLYTISDLHLSHSVKKPMDKFGSRWQGYTEKLARRWNAVVGENDTVVIPGDISWAMTLDEAEADFKFIEGLRGRKLLGKGNHDYWWTSDAKMRTFLDSIGAKSIDFLHNNAHFAENGNSGAIICGSRGWFVEERLQSIPTDYEKLVNREAIRLSISLEAGMKLKDEHPDSRLLVFLHFPPVFENFVCPELIEVMKKYGVTRVFHGHIHGKYLIPPSCEYNGINVEIISSDYLDFYPKKVY